MPSWDSPAADSLWTGACGKTRWRGELETVEIDLRELSDQSLWQFRCEGRQQLINYLRERCMRQNCGRGASTAEVQQSVAVLDPDVLTLGFARRFAEYKRPNLLLHDPQRLARLLNNRDHPVQLVLAGKAHPQDKTGKQLLQAWHDFLARADVQGRVVFVEDYDLGVAEQLIQGVDVWINTPRRPWEASGTSGMKVLVNGGLNLSELDGWWAEAYDPSVGWVLGDGREYEDTVACDAREAEQLYQILEQQVVPCFYHRDQYGLPFEWIERMRESMAHLTTHYSSNRMLREYVENYYLPLAECFRQRDSDTAATIEQWHQQLASHWSHIHFGNVSATQTDSSYQFEVQVYLDELAADTVSVQIYAEPLDDGEPFSQELTRCEALIGTANAFIFRGAVPADRPQADYTPRILPVHAMAEVPLEANFILWYR